jgi:hypothetical protein
MKWMRNAYSILVEKPEGKRPFVRPRHRWEDNIGMGGDGNFSLHHRVQNGSGAHPASYPMGTGGLFPLG